MAWRFVVVRIDVFCSHLTLICGVYWGWNVRVDAEGRSVCRRRRRIHVLFLFHGIAVCWRRVRIGVWVCGQACVFFPFLCVMYDGAWGALFSRNRWMQKLRNTPCPFSYLFQNIGVVSLWKTKLINRVAWRWNSILAVPIESAEGRNNANEGVSSQNARLVGNGGLYFDFFCCTCFHILCLFRIFWLQV